MAIAASELTCITFLLNDIGIYLKSPLILCCDNLSALYVMSNPLFHATTKHIEIDYYFVHKNVANHSFVTLHVPASDELADIFTKAPTK